MKLHQETGRGSWSCSFSLLYNRNLNLTHCSFQISNKTLHVVFAQSPSLRPGQAETAASAQGKSFSLLTGDPVPLTPTASASSLLDTHTRVSQQRYYSETTSATMVLHFCAALATVYVLPTRHTKQSPLLSTVTINLIFSGLSIHSEEPKRILENINQISLSQQNP